MSFLKNLGLPRLTFLPLLIETIDIENVYNLLSANSLKSNMKRT